MRDVRCERERERVGGEREKEESNTLMLLLISSLILLGHTPISFNLNDFHKRLISKHKGG